MSFVEADILIVFEGIRQHTAVLDLCQQILNIYAKLRGAQGAQQVNRRGQKISCAENIALLQMIAGSCQFDEAMDELTALAGFEWDELLKVVVALQKSTGIEELNPPL